MSRKELPLSIVDVESQDSLDWGRGSDNGRMVEDIYCSITSYTLLTHFFQYIADILYDISKIMIVCDIISDNIINFYWEAWIKIMIYAIYYINDKMIIDKTEIVCILL